MWGNWRSEKAWFTEKKKTNIQSRDYIWSSTENGIGSSCSRGMEENRMAPENLKRKDGQHVSTGWMCG